MLRYIFTFFFFGCAGLFSQDATEITKPSQADMVVGTRVPRNMAWSTPDSKERWRVWMRGVALSPGAYLRAGIGSGFGQLANTPKAYGQGWDAYGKRFGSQFLNYTLQDSASQALAAAAGYEMRYVQCKCTKVVPRIGHALAFNFVTYNRNGKKVLNWPSLVGGYGAGMLSSTFTPGQKWSAGGIHAGNNGIYFGFASSLLQEFSPSSFFKKRHKDAPAAATP